MKNRLFLTALMALLAMGLETSVSAQNSQEDLIAKRDKKLEAGFLKNASWTTDYAAARKKAKKSDKLIFAYFTRSYAP